MATANTNFGLRVVAAVFAGVTVLLAAWYYFALRQDYTIVYQDLAPADAAAITTELQQANIPYRIGGDGAQVLVPSSQAARVREEIGAANLRMNALDGFELFNDSDMGLTDFAQKIKYQRAIQGELARTIMMMDGVLEARVHVSVPERTLFRGERRNAEAAVTLVTQAPEDVTPARVEGVQRLVAASVPDLSVSDVVVLNAHGEVISASAATVAPTPSAQPPSPFVRIAESALRRAIPDIAFAITLETPAPPPALDGGDAPESGAMPTRTANVSTSTPLTEEQRARVRAELYAAHFGDGQTIQAVFFDTDLQAQDTPASDNAPPVSAAPVQPSAEQASSGFNLTWLAWLASGVLLLALVVVGILAARGALLRKRLSADQHESFAERLRTGLQLQQQGAGDGGA